MLTYNTLSFKAPNLVDIHPIVGPSSGNTAIELSGFNFGVPADVSEDYMNLEYSFSWDDFQGLTQYYQATTIPITAGEHFIRAHVGSQVSNEASLFVYELESMFPLFVPVGRSTKVWVFGDGFVPQSETFTVHLLSLSRNYTLPLSFENSTSLSFIVPDDVEVRLYDVGIELNGQQISTVPNVKLDVYPVPTLQEITVLGGPLSGGTEFDIQGSFHNTGHLTVFLGEDDSRIPLPCVYMSSTTIRCTTNAFDGTPRSYSIWYFNFLSFDLFIYDILLNLKSFLILYLL